VFKSQLLGNFCKQIVPLLTENDDVIETQTKKAILCLMQLDVYPPWACARWGLLSPPPRFDINSLHKVYYLCK